MDYCRFQRDHITAMMQRYSSNFENLMSFVILDVCTGWKMSSRFSAGGVMGLEQTSSAILLKNGTDILQRQQLISLKAQKLFGCNSGSNCCRMPLYTTFTYLVRYLGKYCG